MWKAFAIFYVLSLAFGLVIGATLLLSFWDEMAYGIKILGGVSLVMALATAIGLVAYAFNLQCRSRRSGSGGPTAGCSASFSAACR
jgi:hypothetical protein